MPNISELSPSWNIIPSVSPVSENIIKHLPLGDLVSLSGVSQAWRKAITARHFDKAAKTLINDRERTGSSTWPSLAQAEFSTDPGDLAGDGLRHVRTLVNLQNAIRRLPSLTLNSARTKEIAPLHLATRDAVVNSSSPSELVAYRDDQTCVLSFVAQNGEVRTPACLANHDVPRAGMREFTVVNSTLNRGSDLMLVRHTETGHLSVYDPTADVRVQLPLDAIEYSDHASISRDGRFVAVISFFDDHTSRLVVFDRHNGIITTNVEFPDRYSTRVSVDSAGTAVVGGHQFGQEIPPGGDLRFIDPLPVPYSIYTLSHDERQIIRAGARTCDIVLEDRETEGQIILTHPGAPTYVNVNCIAFSPANAMAALAYTDLSIAVFDLTDQTSGERLPSAHLQRPWASWQNNEIISFEKDGSQLRVVYEDWQAPASVVARAMELPLVE